MAVIYTKFDGGTRFNDHTIPDDLLNDVQIFVDIIQRHAKHLYLASSQKKKVRKEVSESFRLKIKVFPGSTAFAFQKVNDIQSTLTVGAEEVSALDYVDLAAIEINSLLASISSSPVAIPDHLKDCFDKLGRNLKEDELFKIGKDEAFTNPVVLNSVARQRLRVVSQPYQQACSIRGVVDKFGVFDSSFVLKSSSSLKTIPVQIAPYLFNKIRAIHGETEKYSVKVFGFGRFDVKHQLVAITHGQHIILI